MSVSSRKFSLEIWWNEEWSYGRNEVWNYYCYNFFLCCFLILWSYFSDRDIRNLLRIQEYKMYKCTSIYILFLIIDKKYSQKPNYKYFYLSNEALPHHRDDRWCWESRSAWNSWDRFAFICRDWKTQTRCKSSEKPGKSFLFLGGRVWPPFLPQGHWWFL